MIAAKPFLKWAGGKTALLPKILERIPKKISGTYYEPFLGGGAVFFALAAEERIVSANLADLNEDLVNAYEQIRCNPALVVQELRRYAAAHSEMFFYNMRARNPKPGSVAGAARMIYLNRTCFNGLYRVNKKGEFNVPFGDYKNPKICDDEGLYEVARTLSKYALTSGLDFEHSTAPAKRGDVVYFDPPYVPASATANFTAYAKDPFGPDAHRRLRDCAERLVGRGVHVLLSNSDTPLVRELYAGFELEEVRAPRRINSVGSKRGDVGELLISAKGNW